MRELRDRTVPARTQTIEVKFCDLCRGQITQPQERPEDELLYAICGTDEVTVSRVSSSGGLIDRYEFDVCSDCFETKLIEFFRSHGVEPHYEQDKED